jgi:outer membrane lipoprotein SlyB
MKKIILSSVAAATALTAFPAAAEAQRYYDRGGYYDRGYNQGYYGRTYRDSRYYRGQRRCSGTTGTIVGGAAGALLGREVAGRGDRTLGTILGGAAGALLGREVGKSTCRR